MKKLSIILNICLFLLLCVSIFLNFSKRNSSVENKETNDVSLINYKNIFIKSISLFREEIISGQIRITLYDRGVVEINIFSDLFLDSGSAIMDVETTNKVLSKLVELLSSEEVEGCKFRIEGHTDSNPVGIKENLESNWHLSCERALSILYYLCNFNISEDRMHVAGWGSTSPLKNYDNIIYSERIDIIIDDSYFCY
jgi:chemotaxis protein MotB